MGIPSFYKWLVDKYPYIVVPAKEDEAGAGTSPSPSPGDEQAAGGPNGVYNNIYLDMNGIIHPCFHPEEQVYPPTTFDEVFAAMFECIDRQTLGLTGGAPTGCDGSDGQRCNGTDSGTGCDGSDGQRCNGTD